MNKVRTIFANMSWLMASQIITSAVSYTHLDLSMYYGNGSRYEVSVYNNDGIIKYQDNAKSLVIFNINGMNYTKELVNGKACLLYTSRCV